MQDLTGVPAIADLAAMRDAVARLGGDTAKVEPGIPVDLVIDHSIIADFAGAADAIARNAELEFERNRERYTFLRWAQQAFKTFRVFPPDRGICHQVNLEYLSQVVFRDANGLAYPDTLVGTDSHTPMVNGLGVLGWGVGGIEAEAAMLGQAISMLLPRVVGIKLIGRAAAGRRPRPTSCSPSRSGCASTAWSASSWSSTAKASGACRSRTGRRSATCRPSTARRARSSRSTTRRCATSAPPAAPTISSRWSRRTRRNRASGTTRPRFRSTTRRSSSTSRRSSRRSPGPARPAGPRLAVEGEGRLRAGVGRRAPPKRAPRSSSSSAGALADGSEFELADGAVVIAAITSCTNTSNPSVMIAAGLLARNAVAARAARLPPWVKTSLAPGSLVVTDYYDQGRAASSRSPTLGFDVVGYGCTTCIGNSGPLAPRSRKAVNDARPLGVLGALGQPELRGPHPSRRAG